MADGGFLVKFNGKEFCRCFSIAFDYDEWQFMVNGTDVHPLPITTKSISVEVESE